MTDHTRLASAFLDQHDRAAWFRDPGYDGPCELIDVAKVDELTDDILDLIANIIASILDAGSERDAVNESEDLRQAIRNEVHSWTREAS